MDQNLKSELLERAADLLKAGDFPLWEAGAFCYTILQMFPAEDEDELSPAYLHLQNIRNEAMEAYCH